MPSVAPNAQRLRNALGFLALFLGFTFPKFVCLLCGAIVGELDRAWEILVNLWFVNEPALNFADLPPYMLVAAVTAVGPVGLRAERYGLVAMWLGLLFSQIYFHWSLWYYFLAENGSGVVMLGYIGWPFISLVIIVAFYSIGFAFGWTVDRLRIIKG